MPQAALTLWSEHGSMVRTRKVRRGYGPPAVRRRSRPTLAPVRDQQRRTALITGVTGQDGIYLSRLLLSRGHHVVGAAPPGAMPPELCAAYLADVDLVPLDICDRDDVQRVIDTTEPDEVYNLAAVSSVARSWDEPEATFAVNHAAVETLVRALLELRGRTGRSRGSSRRPRPRSPARPRTAPMPGPRPPPRRSSARRAIATVCTRARPASTTTRARSVPRLS